MAFICKTARLGKNDERKQGTCRQSGSVFSLSRSVAEPSFSSLVFSQYTFPLQPRMRHSNAEVHAKRLDTMKKATLEARASPQSHTSVVAKYLVSTRDLATLAMLGGSATMTEPRGSRFRSQRTLMLAPGLTALHSRLKSDSFKVSLFAPPPQVQQLLLSATILLS